VCYPVSVIYCKCRSRNEHCAIQNVIYTYRMCCRYVVESKPGRRPHRHIPEVRIKLVTLIPTTPPAAGPSFPAFQLPLAVSVYIFTSVLATKMIACLARSDKPCAMRQTSLLLVFNHTNKRHATVYLRVRSQAHTFLKDIAIMRISMLVILASSWPRVVAFLSPRMSSGKPDR
jgi:hypothetical protein